MKLYKFTDNLRLAKQFSNMKYEVGGCDSLPKLTLHTNAYYVRSKDVNWLSQHGGFCFNPPNSPTDYTQSINHRCMRICPNNGVRVVDSLLLQHSLSKVFKIYLMTDSDSRWYDIEALEGLPGTT
jgi:hypothetical protein